MKELLNTTQLLAHHGKMGLQNESRTYIERVHCTLSNSSLPKKCCTEAASTAYCLVNCSSQTSPQLKILQEVKSGNRISYSNLKVFSCHASAHVNQEKREPIARLFN